MENNEEFGPDKNLKLMEQVRQVLRYYHYALRTEKTYCDWIVKYLSFYNMKRHPNQMGKEEIESFLSHLATNRNVSSATQRQALNALVFLYKRVLDIDLGDKLAPTKAKKRSKMPVVMSKKEVSKVLSQMKGNNLLMARLLYGCGLRLMECIRLRIQDLDLERNLLYIRGARGGKDRTVPFPKLVKDQMFIQIENVRAVHNADLDSGFGDVYLPEALMKKYKNASKNFAWQYVFPAKKLSKDSGSDKIRRHHVLESTLQKAVKVAVRRADIAKRVSCHTFRHSFATHLLENGVNIHAVQELMGHSNVKTTEIYTHVMEKDISKIQSPLDALNK